MINVDDVIRYIRKKDPLVGAVIVKDIPLLKLVISNNNFRKTKKLYGSRFNTLLLEYLTKKELYEYCIPIRDIYKKKKTTV